MKGMQGRVFLALVVTSVSAVLTAQTRATTENRAASCALGHHRRVARRWRNSHDKCCSWRKQIARV